MGYLALSLDGTQSLFIVAL